MDFLMECCEGYDEDGRLLLQHGRAEYLSTQKYIHECLSKARGRDMPEVGAGTGRYSIALAREGCSVTAVGLVRHNIDILTSGPDGSEDLRVLQGNAPDLSVFPDDAFDVTPLPGPMYHP